MAYPPGAFIHSYLSFETGGSSNNCSPMADRNRLLFVPDRAHGVIYRLSLRLRHSLTMEPEAPLQNTVITGRWRQALLCSSFRNIAKNYSTAVLIVVIPAPSIAVIQGQVVLRRATATVVRL